MLQLQEKQFMSRMGIFTIITLLLLIIIKLQSLLEKSKWSSTYFSRFSFTTEDISKQGTTSFSIRKTFQYTAAIFGINFRYSCVIINFPSFHFKIDHHLMRRKITENKILSCSGKLVLVCILSKAEHWTLNTFLNKDVWLQTILHFQNYLTVYPSIWPWSSTCSYQKGWFNICKLPYVWHVIEFSPLNQRKQVGWSTNFNQPWFASQT